MHEIKIYDICDAHNINKFGSLAVSIIRGECKAVITRHSTRQIIHDNTVSRWNLKSAFYFMYVNMCVEKPFKFNNLLFVVCGF